MSALRERHPYEFYTRGATIRTNVEAVKRHRWDYNPEHTADSFIIPGAVQDWLDTEFAQEVCSLTATVGLFGLPRLSCCAGPTRALAVNIAVI